MHKRQDPELDGGYTEISLPFIDKHLIFTIRIFNFERVSGVPSKKLAPTIKGNMGTNYNCLEKKSAPTVTGNTGTNTGTDYKPMPWYGKFMIT